MEAKRLMAVDFGASGGKCFVGTFRSESFAMEEIHRFPHEGVSFFIADRSGVPRERAYWNDVLLYRNIIVGLETYRRDVGDTIESIGIDTWGSDGNLFSADGDMLGKVYCYRDHRLDDLVEKLKARIDAVTIYGITGIHFQPFNISNQLLWLVENRPELLLAGSFFLPVPSLFYYYLGGVRKLDSSWASVTQLMDARKKAWSSEILEKLSIPGDLLPEIVEPGTVLGEMHAELADAIGINRAKLVAAAAHDTASAFAAAPVANTDEALIISSGTWSLVGKLVPQPITTGQAMGYNISNEGGIGNIRCLKNCMGTWLVQELRRVWRIADGKEMAWEEITRLAKMAPAFQTLIDPDDGSFYNPANMQDAIAAFCSRTRQEPPADRGGYIRTVYESLALKYRMVNEQICDVSSSETKVVHIVGGGSKNGLLNQFTADALGLPVLAGPEEATAVGNFMVQAMGLGIIDTMHEALPIIKEAFPIAEYTPRDTATWSDAYARFREVCGETAG